MSTEINDWVSNTTNGRIIELVKEEDMETDMIIANAAYFQGSWLHQFNKNNTVEDIFYSFKGKHHVDMMVQKGNFRHGKLVLDTPCVLYDDVHVYWMKY